MLLSKIPIFIFSSFSLYRAAARYFHGKKCLNCNREGHLAKSCPEPKRNPVCFMCMEEGHSHSSCPNQHCLRCGKSGEPYSENCRKCRYLDTMDCRLCGGRGHIQSRCPDTWRRYHATTTPNTGEEMKKSFFAWNANANIYECDFRLKIMLTPTVEYLKKYFL